MSNNAINEAQQTVGVDDLDSFVRHLTHWHTHKVQLCKHMKEIPEFTEITLDDGTPFILTAYMRDVFAAGISVALSELGTLPFVVEMETDAAAA